MMEISPVRAFEDNYIWMLSQQGVNAAVAVDPGDETPVFEWLRAQAKRLVAILITHHHYDHTGGVPELVEAYPGIPVYGPSRESIRGVNQPLVDGDRISFDGLDGSLTVLDVPGHTAGHIAYFGDGALFCGDTLFAAGCGRVFDGTLAQLSHSLQRIAGLPADTGIYCAHEYTLDNLGFAVWVEPESEALKRRIVEEQRKRQAAEPTLPSALSLELETNPFLRAGVRQVREAAERASGRPLSTPVEIFTALRQWKDREYD
jgi:hydroxyacylglutathione hydrolase